jgi:hypothetical protein
VGHQLAQHLERHLSGGVQAIERPVDRRMPTELHVFEQPAQRVARQGLAQGRAREEAAVEAQAAERHPVGEAPEEDGAVLLQQLGFAATRFGAHPAARAGALQGDELTAGVAALGQPVGVHQPGRVVVGGRQNRLEQPLGRNGAGGRPRGRERHRELFEQPRERRLVDLARAACAQGVRDVEQPPRIEDVGQGLGGSPRVERRRETRVPVPLDTPHQPAQQLRGQLANRPAGREQLQGDERRARVDLELGARFDGGPDPRAERAGCKVADRPQEPGSLERGRGGQRSDEGLGALLLGDGQALDRGVVQGAQPLDDRGHAGVPGGAVDLQQHLERAGRLTLHEGLGERERRCRSGVSLRCHAVDALAPHPPRRHLEDVAFFTSAARHG